MNNKVLLFIFCTFVSISKVFSGYEVFCESSLTQSALYCEARNEDLGFEDVISNPHLEASGQYFVSHNYEENSVWVVTRSKIILPDGHEIFHDIDEEEDVEAQLKDLIEHPEEYDIDEGVLMAAAWSEHDGGENRR